MMTQFNPPPHATHHCRHYSYEGSAINGGPRCALGVDLSAPGAGKQCWPKPVDPPPCDRREEFTADEHVAWQTWVDAQYDRMRMIMPLIPGNSTDRKNGPEWGNRGSFACPACKSGAVQWVRARVNGHVHAACTTPYCFSVRQ